MPIRKLTKKEIKQQRKPWITNGIRTSIKREKIYKRCIKENYKYTKDGYHGQYKELRNKIINLCNQSKKTFSKLLLTKC